MKIAKKIMSGIGNMKTAFHHPGKTLARLFENDKSASWVFGIISALLWLLMAFSNPKLSWPALIVLTVGVAIFFLVAQLYDLMPTGDEHWGRAPKRNNTTLFYVLAAIILIALIINSSLFIHWAG